MDKAGVTTAKLSQFVPSYPMPDHARGRHSLTPSAPALRSWLLFCACLVFLMVVIGGLTRLTESGLSIVEWKLVTGILPPLNETQWQEEFARYQTSPQYRNVNSGMDVAAFKSIYWLEYLHRLLGRLVGVAFFVPLLFFLARKRIPPQLRPRLVAIFLLGGMQGAIGWYMVKSGLIDMPMVSPLRLAFHLSLAFVLFALLLWSAYDCGVRRWQNSSAGLRKFSSVTIALVLAQVILGALVAGLDAGLVYNSFPTMNGQWMPSEIAFLNPWWRNLWQNAATVQFMHRMGAYIVAVTLGIFAVKLMRNDRDERLKKAGMVLLLLLAAQFTLGVLTLLYQVPVPLASLHQAFALILFGHCVTIRHGFTATPALEKDGAQPPHEQLL